MLLATTRVTTKRCDSWKCDMSFRKPWSDALQSRLKIFRQIIKSSIRRFNEGKRKREEFPKRCKNDRSGTYSFNLETSTDEIWNVDHGWEWSAIVKRNITTLFGHYSDFRRKQQYLLEISLFHKKNCMLKIL